MPLYIIAECAQGYASRSSDESLSLALLLTRSAKSAGADAVKFQLVVASELATEDYKHYDLFKSLDIGYSRWQQVSELANELGLDLIFDIFGESSLRMAEALGATSIKLHPTDFTNSDLIRRVAASSIKNVIAGCGGCTLDQIQATSRELLCLDSLTLMHGFQGYPTPRADNCLSRLQLLRNILPSPPYPIRLGFADHADPLSPDSSHLAATSLGYGVSVLEKHLTLARCLQLEDHESALSPDEFLSFVETTRSCYDAIAAHLCQDSSFTIPASETVYRQSVARHVVATSDLAIGHTVLPSDICLKRTSADHAFTDPLFVIGRKTLKSILANTPFTPDTING